MLQSKQRGFCETSQFDSGHRILPVFWIPLLAIPASLIALVCGIIVIAKGREHRQAGRAKAIHRATIFGAIGVFAAGIMVIIALLVGPCAAWFGS